jgi:hypothetical protein
MVGDGLGSGELVPAEVPPQLTVIATKRTWRARFRRRRMSTWLYVSRPQNSVNEIPDGDPAAADV